LVSFIDLLFLVYLAGARRDEVVLRVSLHSSGLSKVKSTHTGTESQMCHEKKELEYEILGEY
jgi:hypothetical protein